jgi:hypothetical protein
MSPKRRVPSAHTGPEENTRPDTVPAALRFAELSSPDLEPPPHRELAPYPTLPSRLDEPTVSYAIVSPVIDSHERSVTDASAESSSGARHRLASTVPPPSRTRNKPPVTKEVERVTTPLPTAARIPTPLPGAARIVTPLPGAASRIATPLPSVVPAPIRTSVPVARSAPPADPRQSARLILVAVVSSFLAAAIGASLGNGSLMRAVDAVRGKTVATPPTPAAVAPVKPTSQRVGAAAPQPAAAPVAAAEVPPVPVVRLQDLPESKRGEPEPEPKPQRHPRQRR